MKPGATARPPQSITRASAGTSKESISAMVSPEISRSPRRGGAPVPSTSVPPLSRIRAIPLDVSLWPFSVLERECADLIAEIEKTLLPTFRLCRRVSIKPLCVGRAARAGRHDFLHELRRFLRAAKIREQVAHHRGVCRNPSQIHIAERTGHR